MSQSLDLSIPQSLHPSIPLSLSVPIFSILLVAFLVTGSGFAATVKLAWDPNPATDKVTGYNIYRSSTPGGGYVKLNASPVTTPFYRDNAPDDGKAYYYVVRAVSATGETGDSNEVSYAPVSFMSRFPVRLSTKRVLVLLITIMIALLLVIRHTSSTRRSRRFS